MTDICLPGIFLLCAAAGCYAVAPGTDFIEFLIFKDSKMCYTEQRVLSEKLKEF